MWEVIHHVLDQYQNLGFIALFALVMCGVCALLMYDAGKMLIKKYSNKNWKTRLPKPSEHRVFNFIDLVVEMRIPAMRVFCPLRKKIFNKLLKILLETMKAYMMKMAKDNVNDMTNEEYRNYWENILIRIFAEADIRMKEAGIPMLAIKRFHEQNRISEEVLMKHMFMTCNSETIYDSNKEKTLAIFMGVELLIEAMLQAVERTIDTINGELSTCTFEGMGCLECREGCPLKKDLHMIKRITDAAANDKKS